MKTMIKQLVILAAMALAIVPSAYASSTWRCGSNLVSTGNTQFDVVSRCGEPREKNFLGWGRRVADGWGNYFEDVPIEEWVYYDSRSVYYVLKFEGNVLRNISSHFSY